MVINNWYIKKKIIMLMLIAIFISFLCVLSQGQEIQGQENIPEGISTVSSRCRVVELIKESENQIESSGGNFENSIQLVKVKILNGKYKNQIVMAEYGLSLAFSEKQNNTLLKVGDEALVTMELDSDDKIVHTYIYNVVRDKSILLLLILFAIVILLVGRMKGLRTLITLALTILAIFYILLPLILKGFDPVFITIWVCIAITAITLALVSGFNKKSLSALIGTTGGVIAAGIIAKIAGHMAKLTGLGDEESQMLLYIPQDISFDYKGLLFAGIILGALGAAMDVGLSLTSAMFEIKEHNPKIKKAQLFSAGMNVGRDMMATMSNTLILAYVGGSLQLLLLLMAYQIPLIEMINQDGLASEIVRSLAGSIGLILTIPITALAASLLSQKE